MLVDVIVKANDYLQISSYILNPHEYWKYCIEFAVPKDKLEHFKNITPQDIICSQFDLNKKSAGATLKEKDFAVSNVKIDWIDGLIEAKAKSSASSQDYESDEKFTIPDDRISHLLPTSYQNMIFRVYAPRGPNWSRQFQMPLRISS
ncbi:hypothetical protein MLD38_000158 [Melastoma candidum]|uniref:Uncharacterized protein n=1 Tax=Melastoma candidum TaxID=119954 RepID=A0ACB9SAH0_9MYRT|nr:hypothetical protein MLD38_000158 [Melastoma candidum]